MRSRISGEMRFMLETRFGRITDEESLSGVAGSGGVRRLTFENGESVIVKASVKSNERKFYERMADVVRHAGVGVPDLFWSGEDALGLHWIAIEYIPFPWPSERWLGDRQQTASLVRLHSATWGDPRPELDNHAYRPAWNDSMTELVSEWLHESGKERLTHLIGQLRELQQQSQKLFAPLCALSGDANPSNWRIRDNKELVWIDWERFCCGHPAIDVAISIPGMGSLDGEIERRSSEAFKAEWLRVRGAVPDEFQSLSRLVRLAKLWSAVEFLANARRSPALYPTKTVLYIIKELPTYVDVLASNL